jgi:glycosyltransferase involved in cell wall biosynthesis
VTAAGGVVYLASEWPWPVTSGGRQRIAAIASAIEAAGSLCTLLAPNEPSEWPAWSDAAEALHRRRRNGALRMQDVATALAAGEHVVLRRAAAAGLVDAFQQVLGQVRPRLTILGRPFLGPFVDAARSVGSRVIAEVDESLAGVARSALRAGTWSPRARALLELQAFERYERREYQRADEIWVSSSNELRRIRRINAGTAIRIVPNVTVVPIDDVASKPAPVRGMGFVGWYGYPPNEQAAIALMDEILPIVEDLGGPARLSLIGRDPTPRMVQRARGRAVIRITGQVPDVLPYLREAGLLVCPIRSGGGTRVKIIEAMASGVPVISTPLGVQGLELVPGRDAWVAESSRELAEAVVRLAADPAEITRMTTAARRVVAATYSPEALRIAIRSALATPQGGQTAR